MKKPKLQARHELIGEVLKSKHWVFTAPYGLELEDGKVIPRKREDEEYIKVSDIQSLLDSPLLQDKQKSHE